MSFVIEDDQDGDFGGGNDSRGGIYDIDLSEEPRRAHNRSDGTKAHGRGRATVVGAAGAPAQGGGTSVVNKANYYLAKLKADKAKAAAARFVCAGVIKKPRSWSAA